ncbi:hypothetical protein [Kordia zhangzhouensis]|uniref:hypothetical protein n=1 Tax=Kordia zhangzhouensis TaxID=1620405 RepID=UPI000629AB5A|nr:hypothetical protein [Kordia zhangzhouensis]
MIKNSKISSNINQWNIEYDQNGFASDENWLITAEKKEDILQLSHIYQEGPVLDVGFYTENYKIYSFIATIGINQKKSLNPK